MNSQDNALRVLEDWADSEGGLEAIGREYDGDVSGAVETLALNDALMPDLPEPDLVSDGTAVWLGGVLSVQRDPNGDVLLARDHIIPAKYIRRLAQALLAAEKWDGR